MRVLLTHLFSLLFAGVVLTGAPFPSSEPISGYGFLNAFPGLRFEEPVGIVSAPGETNRIFVIERKGKIRVIPNLGNPSVETFLDLPDTWSNGIEAGLLGLAFHPNYQQNGRFFIYRTVRDSRHRCELSEFQVSEDPNIADADSHKLIISQIDGIDTHNAGDLKFGPDGYLYLSIGDESPPLEDSHTEPQAIDKGFFAGIFRIDVDNAPQNLPPNAHPSVIGTYKIPRDNPFVGASEFIGLPVDPRKVRTEFYAVGLRNPWRFTFDPLTGELICADVGAGYFEEVNVITPGGNYGWPYFEAKLQWHTNPPPSLSGPLYHYAHGTENFEGRAVIGGVIVEDEALPELKGRYLFADFESGTVFALNTRARETNASWVTARRGITTFAVDPRDRSTLVANMLNGTIERLVHERPGDFKIPARLRELQLFTNLSTLSPKSSLLAYDVINPLWSDGAVKQRWVSLEHATEKMTFAETEPWSFPLGTYWVKHFELELTNGIAASRRRVETRVLVQGSESVYGLSYRWDDSQKDATLLPAYATNDTFIVSDGGIIRTQVWNYPSRDQCKTCHTPAGGGALSFNTYQLNRSVLKNGGVTNQLSWLKANGFFKNESEVIPSRLPRLSSLEDSFAPAEHKVRSYLFSNCSHCHQPANQLLGPRWDGRISTALSKAGIVGEPSFFYPPPMKLISPGSITNSFIHSRTSVRAMNYQMPPLATTEVDHAFLSALTNWISSFPDETWNYTTIGEALAESAAEQTPNGVRIYSTGGGLAKNSFHFAHREAAGSIQLIAKISDFKAPTPDSETGIMFRNQLSRDGAYAAVLLKDETLFFKTASSAGEAGPSSSPIAASSYSWLRLLKEGSNVSGWASIDGVEWVLIGSTRTDLRTQIHAGMFVASAAPAVHYARAEFKPVTLHSLTLSANISPDLENGGPITLHANTVHLPGQAGLIDFYVNDLSLTTSSNSPNTALWERPTRGTFTLTAVLRGSGNSVTSNPVVLTLEDPRSAAWIGQIDAITQGAWQNQYGSEAVLVPGVLTNRSATVEMVSGKHLGPTWIQSDDSAAIPANGIKQKVLARGNPSPEITFRALDYLPHRGAIYLHDWQNIGGEQTITLLNRQSQVLGVYTVDSTLPVYFTFAFAGEVIARIENKNGSGYFSAAFIAPVAPIQVELTSPAADTVLRQPVSLKVAAVATAPGREIARVEFRDGNQALASTGQAPFEATLTNLLVGDHFINAFAIGTFGSSAISESRRVTVLPPPSRADLIGMDTNTLGSWRGRYGEKGYWIIQDELNLTNTINLSLNGQAEFTFVPETDDERALQRGSGGGRVAACLFALPEFSFTVSVLDGSAPVVGFYFLDWNDAGRIMNIVVEDESGNVLDEEPLRDFSSGKYLFWRIQGTVKFRFSAPEINAVLSGFFVEPDLTSYELWRNNTFKPAELSTSDDFDRDGFSNQLEYALGFDARSATDRPEFSCTFADGFLTTAITHRELAANSHLRFEVSTDLINWTQQSASTRANDVSLRIPASAKQQFVRLIVSERQ